MTIHSKTLKDRILSGGGWAFGSKIGTSLATVGFSAILAKLMPPDELGTVFLAFSVVAVLGLFSTLGMEQASVRLLSESMARGDYSRANGIVKKALGITICVSIGLGLLVWIVVGKFLSTVVFSAPALGSVVGWMGIWVVAHGMNILLGEIFRGFHDIRIASFFSGGTIYGGLLSSILIGILLLIAHQWTTISLQSVLAILVFSRVASMIIALGLLYLKTKGHKKSEISIGTFKLTRIGMPILISNMSLIVLAQTDLWIIGAFRSEAEVALYGTATRVVKIIGLTLIVVNEVVAPLIAELNVLGKLKKLEDLLRTASAFAAFPAVVAFLLIIVASKPFLGFFFGDYYASGSTVLIFLSIGQVAYVFLGSTGNALSMTGHQKALMLISTISSCITIFGGLSVVGKFGVTGVAAMAASGMLVQKIAGLLAVKKLCGIWTLASPKQAVKFIREVRTAKL